MPFGLSDAYITLFRMVTQIFHSYLEFPIIVDSDNDLVLTTRSTRIVDILRKENFYVDLKKWTFLSLGLLYHYHMHDAPHVGSLVARAILFDLTHREFCLHMDTHEMHIFTTPCIFISTLYFIGESI